MATPEYFEYTRTPQVFEELYVKDTDGNFVKVGGDDDSAVSVSWDDVADKPETFPPVIGTGSDEAMAGDTELLTIGTTGTTAAAGNHTHTAADINATAIAPGTATDVQGILAELQARIEALDSRVADLEFPAG